MKQTYTREGNTTTADLRQLAAPGYVVRIEHLYHVAVTVLDTREDAERHAAFARDRHYYANVTVEQGG